VFVDSDGMARSLLGKRHADTFEQNHRLGEILIRHVTHPERHREEYRSMSNVPSKPSDKRAAIDAFLAKARTPAARGRLVFAIDATGSRQATWDTACQLQGEMFQEVATVGGLDIQLIYYRGLRECSASRWVSDAQTLAGLMEGINCQVGHTQIGRVLDHARKENIRQKVAAMVFVGDCCEEEPADLYAAARELEVPVFLFQEGDDPTATKVFREIAQLTKGAHCRFDPGSARQLAELLRAVAVYAAGGRQALLASGNAGALKLLEEIKEG
jgi:hypothetical protein